MFEVMIDGVDGRIENVKLLNNKAVISRSISIAYNSFNSLLLQQEIQRLKLWPTPRPTFPPSNYDI